MVGTGILLSRISGLIRERVFAHYFGSSDAADVFKAALRIPNFLQNLFGEGVLSASFIPVYSRLRSEGKEQDAQALAILIGMVLFAVVTLLVTLGVWLTPELVSILAPGFVGEKRQYTVDLVQILFPGIGLLVLSAWCLGVLNSHGRFFLSYSAPVLWNAAIIAALVYFGGLKDQYQLAILTAYGVVLGSLLQTAIQLPATGRFITGFPIALRAARAHALKVFENFVPVVIGRGVIQISAFVDSLIASLLPAGAVAGLAYAQTIYLLPISLFGISISAAELPSMSALRPDGEESRRALRDRLSHALSRMGFFVVPSAVACLLLGDLLATLLYQSGKFTDADSRYVWGILAGAALGLVAATMGRLYSSTCYAMHDTRTPLKYALLRIFISIAVGSIAALYLPAMLGIDARWGVAALTATSGLIAWLELFLLRRAVHQMIGPLKDYAPKLASLWFASLFAAAIAWSTKIALIASPWDIHPAFKSGFILTVFGAAYLLISILQGNKQAEGMLRRLPRFRR